MRTEMEFLVKANTEKLAELNRRIDEYDKQARKSAVSSEKLDTATIAMTASMAAGAIAVYAMGRAFSEAIRQAEEFEQGIIGVQKTTGLAGEELSQLQKEIFTLGTTIKGVKTSELFAIAQTAGQLGIKGVENLRSFTETIAMVGVATDLTAEQAATSFAQLQNILGITTPELSRLGSVFNEVSNNSTALVSDLVAFTSRIGGAGKTIGLTYDQIIGLSAALKDTGNNFEVGGSAVSRALISMISDTQKFADVTNTTFDEFSGLLRDKPIEAVKLFINQLNRLDPDGRVAALKKVGLQGIEASSVFLKLAEGAGKVEQNLAIANKEFKTATSLLTEYNAASKSSIASTERLGNVIDQFQSRIATPFLGIKKEAADLATGMVLVFDEGFNQIGFRIDDLQVRFKRLSVGTQLELQKSFLASTGGGLNKVLQSAADSVNEITGSNIGSVLVGVVGSKLPEFMLGSAESTKKLEKEFDNLVTKNEEIGKASEESLKKFRELTEEILSGTKKLNESAPSAANIKVPAAKVTSESFNFDKALDDAWTKAWTKAVSDPKDEKLLQDAIDKYNIEVKKIEVDQAIQNTAEMIAWSVSGAVEEGIASGNYSEMGEQIKREVIIGIGRGIGTAIGSAYFGPVGGIVGGAVGAGIGGAIAGGGNGDSGLSAQEKWLEQQTRILEQIRDNTDKLNEFDLTGTALQTGLRGLGEQIVIQSFATGTTGGPSSSGYAYNFTQDLNLSIDELIKTLQENPEALGNLSLTEIGTQYISEANDAITQFQDVIYGIGQASGDTSIQLQNAENALKAANIGFDGSAASYQDITDQVKSYNSTLYDLDRRMTEAVKAGNELEQLKIADEIESFTEANSELLTGILDNYDAFKLLGDEFSSVAGGAEDLTNKFISMTQAMEGITTNQQSFIDKTIGLTQSGKENLSYLEDRIKQEDKEADALRARIASGDKTAENIAQLAKEEQDVLNIADQLTQAYTTQFGSTEAATTGIQGVLDLVKENQTNTFTLEQQMLTEAQSQTNLLIEVRDGIAVLINNTDPANATPISVVSTGVYA